MAVGTYAFGCRLWAIRPSPSARREWNAGNGTPGMERRATLEQSKKERG
ncbi:MAG TPA: hypothetical protein PLM60_04430 [Methanoregulaceae archaeon]|nr:hypothetical protein [Methanoregulaceae archaeon]HNL86915.1 hypothetical protein [Methanoregulaceae archaeon]HNO07735.1 hypothetical protein [Methanoregulaceae archaeon]HPS22636.1 hypothetical protein [Methanoregulaceae archaeon]